MGCRGPRGRDLYTRERGFQRSGVLRIGVGRPRVLSAGWGKEGRHTVGTRITVVPVLAIFWASLTGASAHHGIVLQVPEIRVISPKTIFVNHTADVGWSCNVKSTIYVTSDRDTRVRIIGRTGWVDAEAGKKVPLITVKEAATERCEVTGPCRLEFEL